MSPSTLVQPPAHAAPRLNLIGGGRLGRTLARAWRDAGAVAVGAIVCRSIASADAAAGFIGAGEPRDALAGLPPAALWLIATGDGDIAPVAAALAAQDVVRDGDLVFHASGALDAAVLAPLAARGALTGSLHPALSFADPARALGRLAGTPCAIDGDAPATLGALAQAFGGRPFTLADGGKAAYHAAMVTGSNYLVALVALAQRLAAQAGIAPDDALAVLGPLMRQTLDNALELGPVAALTGPIARGDAGTVARHLAVIDEQPARDAYLALGRATLPLAQLDDAQRRALAALLAG
ncbi:Rossmann-like and DUF2520 domain-containing protein [Jeongeupia sp. USM3]|uniref:Rossmann-like and DUF2520 domain-containing protein n=1 Tax=Jeongeupia sp. USM3 TaxID=1906741 RepID=UPI00089E04B2|nr:Rossmann-like and DUF2520 domain-containing protein [Jeongeupia sp. USM3]AOY01122.1 hypothetical protein BJP62_12105 [Jeongeupia sp. USM3]